MSIPNQDNSRIRILLSEGSSTNVREMITALGPCGYTIDICDPNPLCMGRFSRYVRKVMRCPISGKDPIGYLKFVIRLLESGAYDVLFPANEQAYLFSWAKDVLTPLVGLAVADFPAFNRLQTKSAFMQFLDELGISHPRTRLACTWDEIMLAADSFAAPFYIKVSYGTASTGVWRVERMQDLPTIRTLLERQDMLDGNTEFLVQEAAGGRFEQSHAIFDRGRLIALHCTRRLVEGAGGGAIVKTGVERPEVRRHFEMIGERLAWHGSLSMDYFWDEASRTPSYIDANPRITEPMNAVVNGINLADLQVRLSLGESIESFPVSCGTTNSHNGIQGLLGAAERRGSRTDVFREFCSIGMKNGIYAGSQGGTTPILQDFPSLLPFAKVFVWLLVNPRSSDSMARKTIADYSLGSAIPLISRLDPRILCGSGAGALHLEAI